MRGVLNWHADDPDAPSTAVSMGKRRNPAGYTKWDRLMWYIPYMLNADFQYVKKKVKETGTLSNKDLVELKQRLDKVLPKNRRPPKVNRTEHLFKPHADAKRKG